MEKRKMYVGDRWLEQTWSNHLSFGIGEIPNTSAIRITFFINTSLYTKKVFIDSVYLLVCLGSNFRLCNENFMESISVIFIKYGIFDT